MSKPELISNVEICACPFCNTSVELDIAQVLSQPPAREKVEIDLRNPASPKLFVFKGKPRADVPCRHVIDLTLDGFIAPTRSTENATYQFHLGWKHEWLLRNDADEILLPFAWEVLDEDEYMPFCPSSLHEREKIDEMEFSLSSGQILTVYGDLFTAEYTVKYLRELRACNRRFQAQSR